MNVEVKVKEVVAAQLGVNAADLSVDQKLTEVCAQVDELDFIEIVMALEDSFEREVDETKLPNQEATVAQLVALFQ
jgi:acyl carrier protein